MPPRSSPPDGSVLEMLHDIGMGFGTVRVKNRESTENAAIASTERHVVRFAESCAPLEWNQPDRRYSECNVPWQSALASTRWPKDSRLATKMGSRSFLSDMNAIDWLDTFKQDIRYGARQLRRRPRLHNGSCSVAGPRHRREYRHLSARECCPAARTACRPP